MKKKDSGPTRHLVESASVSLESGGQEESNGIRLEAVASLWQSIGRLLKLLHPGKSPKVEVTPQPAVGLSPQGSHLNPAGETNRMVYGSRRGMTIALSR